MKLTQVLCRHHLQRMARRHWFIQGKKRIVPTKAEEHVVNRGIPVFDAVDTFIKPPTPIINFDLQAVSEAPIPKDSKHPDYKIEPCYIYGDNNALLAGLEQAQVLTNTLVINETLPEAVKIPSAAHDELKKKILVACVFDAEQKKLPKRKDPLRPAWNFPRDYGITDVRKNTLLCTYIARICDGIKNNRDLSFVNDVNVTVPLEASGKQIQLELSAEILVTSEARLTPAKNPQDMRGSQLPSIYPMDCTVSIEPQHFYTLSDHYPISVGSKWKHAHTAFIHFNSTQVQNLYDSPVTPNQRDGRLLLKAYSFAAAEARALDQIKAPVTVQAVQTDGQKFSFAVYQLNTLDREDSEKRNFCWISPSVHLYTSCGYLNGRPNLEGYNPEVLERIMGFLSKR